MFTLTLSLKNKFDFDIIYRICFDDTPYFAIAVIKPNLDI